MVALELGRGPPPPPPPRASPRGLTQGFVLITRWQSCRGVLGSSPWLAEKGPEQQPKVLKVLTSACLLITHSSGPELRCSRDQSEPG